MLTATDPTEQYASARDDPLRVLIVGAGVAGVTIAALLQHQGLHPVLIERADEQAADIGYMLALMPLVDPVFDELGIRERYREVSIPFDRYAVRSHNGRLLREDSLGTVFAHYGDYRGLDRPALIDVLSGAGLAVSFGTVVTGIRDDGNTVHATLAGVGAPREQRFDLVVVADGIHSRTRQRVLDGRAVRTVDTGWGGWVAWARADNDPGRGEELWGDGFFVGTYPVPGRIGVFVGGPNEDTAHGAPAFVSRIRERLPHAGSRVEDALEAIVADDEPYYWPMTDCRASAWALGRSVLLGDAAAGFLPTAGVGAAMAMESALALARAMRGASRTEVAERLENFEQHQRPRVETAQDNSRALARLVFRRGRLLALLRNSVTRMMSVRVALRPIRKLLESAPQPGVTAPSRSR